ncbi:hypothetical protein [Roseivirga misakiensis]|uniref:Uncharacterized protein n=1 Tax=Roseivirga misakiensis TaxID=1563681 RepID=A0A1E5T5I9_9BACT|nr:hypothetical protein [Roseivirga misakiensis]OEK06654.1 hypothetical protein BFP71_03030 [Roseivirga misakiensis]
MKAIMTLILGAFLMTQSSDPAKVVGDWEGTIEAPGQSIKIIFHVTNTDGKLSSTLDVPQQGAMGLKVDSTSFKDDKIKMVLNLLPASFEGTLKDGKITGKWSQGGGSADAVLTKAKKTGKS